MIETEQDYNRFLEENQSGDLFLQIIPAKNRCHPAKNRAAILFIRNISSGKTYYYSFGHPDSFPAIHQNVFYTTLHSMKNRKWTVDKKAFNQMLKVPDLLDVNLVGYLIDNSTIESDFYDTKAHYLVRGHCGTYSDVNLVIPLVKHLESFNALADDLTKLISDYKINPAYVRVNDLIISTLGDLEANGIFVDKDKFKKHFEIDVDESRIVHSQYNLYTSTGRPSNSFDGVNYAAMNQSDGSRSCFISRYGNDGRMVLIDYTAFHPRIICILTKYDLAIDVDIYAYLAKLYFHKDNVDEFDIKEAKKITFRQLYGGVEEKYAHIKYLSNLKNYIDEQWEFFKKNGYVLTPLFKRKITDHHILEASPTKVFNYILQGVEGELAIPKIQSVQEYLKNRKTKAILYTYDSVLYDFHKDDGFETLTEIRRIMSFDGKFPMKTYIGESYQNMKLIEI